MEFFFHFNGIVLISLHISESKGFDHLHSHEMTVRTLKCIYKERKIPKE